MNRITHRVLRERKCNRAAFRRAPVSAAPVPEEFDYHGPIDEATEFRGRCPKLKPLFHQPNYFPPRAGKTAIRLPD